MNSLSLLSTVGLLSALPFARGEPSQPYRMVISAEEQILLEERIDAAVRTATGLTALKGLEIDWAGMRCLPAGQELHPDLGLGVCVVKASAASGARGSRGCCEPRKGPRRSCSSRS